MKAPMRTVEREQVRSMFAGIAERYDLANTVLSFGIHHIWKRALCRRVDSSATVLDLCTGTGDLLPLLGARSARVAGLDICFPMLAVGAKRARVAKFPMIQGDVLALPFKDGAFDLITVAFGVRNLEDLHSGLTEIMRVLKPGGTLRVLEFGQPRLRPFAALYNIYSRYFMPRIGALLTGNRAAYEYLPETAARFPCGPEFVARLAQAGFETGGFTAHSFGIAYSYEARRPGVAKRTEAAVDSAA